MRRIAPTHPVFLAIKQECPYASPTGDKTLILLKCLRGLKIGQKALIPLIATAAEEWRDSHPGLRDRTLSPPQLQEACLDRLARQSATAAAEDRQRQHAQEQQERFRRKEEEDRQRQAERDAMTVEERGADQRARLVQACQGMRVPVSVLDSYHFPLSEEERQACNARIVQLCQARKEARRTSPASLAEAARV